MTTRAKKDRGFWLQCPSCGKDAIKPTGASKKGPTWSDTDPVTVCKCGAVLCVIIIDDEPVVLEA